MQDKAVSYVDTYVVKLVRVYGHEYQVATLQGFVGSQCAEAGGRPTPLKHWCSDEVLRIDWAFPVA